MNYTTFKLDKLPNNKLIIRKGYHLTKDYYLVECNN